MKSKLFVSEIFYSIQGEGKSIGKPSAFLRLAGCNLNCEWCDSKYAQKGRWMPISDIVKQLISIFNKSKATPHLVITGGEPLLQQNNLKLLLKDLFLKYQSPIHIEIETNGTICPSLGKDFFRFISFVISPKLQSSGIKTEDLTTLKSFMSSPWQYIFKFAVKDKKDLKQVKTIVKQLNIPLDKVYLMPVGITSRELLSKGKMLAEECLKEGYNLTTRLHILIWGNKRGK